MKRGMNEKSKRMLKALSVCAVIAIVEFLVLWLTAVLAIYYGPDEYYFVHYFIIIHSTVVGLTAIADIPLFALVFYFMLRQKRGSSLRV